MRIKFSKKIVALMLSIVILFQFIGFVEGSTDKIANISDEISVVKEDITKRGEFEKHYLMSDGQYLTLGYNTPVHYKENGEWTEIDNTLTKKSGVIKNADKQFNVEFSEQADTDNLVKVTYKDYEISWSVYGESAEEPEEETTEVASEEATEEITGGLVKKPIDGFSKKTIGELTEETTIEPVKETTRELTEIALSSKTKAKISSLESLKNTKLTEKNIEDLLPNSVSELVYENALEDTDIRYTISSHSVKEDIIINEPGDVVSYAMDLNTNGLTASLNEDNSITLYDEDDEPCFIIHAPFMFDDVGESTSEIAVELTEAEAGYTIRITPNAEWLSDPSRVYPVTLDPSLSTVNTNNAYENVSDTYVHEGDAASHNHQNEGLMYIGNKTSQKHRAYIKYNYMPTLSNCAITEAKFKLQFHTGTSTWGAGGFSLYRVNTKWESKGLTWANQPTNLTLISSGVKNDSNKVVTFDVTSVVREWYTSSSVGANNNNGFGIRYTNESNNDFNTPYSSECSTASYRPNIAIKYYGSAKPIADGTYFIRAKHTSNKYLDVVGNGTANGNAVCQYTFSGNTNQQWVVKYFDSGFYSLRPKYATGMALDVTGDKVDIWAAIESPVPAFAQWMILKNDDGSMSLYNKQDLTKAITAPNGSTGDIDLKELTYTGANYQKWVFESSGSYRESKSRSQNCMGYVLNKNQELNPAQVSGATKSSQYAESIRSYISKITGKTCKSISSYTETVSSNEYRAAFRMHPNNTSFHIIYQLSDGTWAGKNGTGGDSKHFGNSNPSTTPAMWDNDFYPQWVGTIYFAITI